MCRCFRDVVLRIEIKDDAEYEKAMDLVEKFNVSVLFFHGNGERVRNT